MTLYDLIETAGSIAQAANALGVSTRTVVRWVESYSKAEIRTLRNERGIQSTNPFSEIESFNPAKVRKEVSAVDIVMGLSQANSLRGAAKQMGVQRNTFGRRYNDYSDEQLLEAFRELVKSGDLEPSARVQLPTRNVTLTMNGVERGLSSLL